MIGLGEKRGGLFHLLQPASKFSTNPSVNYAVLKTSSTDLWHFRLGHVSNSRISMLHKLVPFISVDSNKICNICPMAK
jgi:hypothetical protein